MAFVKESAIASLVIQLITGLVEYTGLWFPIPQKHEIVKDILKLELIVQAIEFVFYSFLVYKILTNTLTQTITSQRYLDWAITTPTMLVNFALFFKYLKFPDQIQTFWGSLSEEWTTLIPILIANGLMLLFGYLAELGIIRTAVSVSIGFIPFAYIFKQLYANYVADDLTSLLLFYFVFFVWSLYGVAATLPFALKNTFYNILDLFSKNAYGLFLYFYLRKVSQETETENIKQNL